MKPVQVDGLIYKGSTLWWGFKTKMKIQFSLCDIMFICSKRWVADTLNEIEQILTPIMHGIERGSIKLHTNVSTYY